MQFRKTVSTAIFAAATALAAPAAMANLITNGDFANGSTGWQLSSFWVNSNFGAGGSAAIITGCVGHSCVATAGSGAYLRQTVNTTAGTTYNLNFLVGETGGANSEFSVFWNGTLIADVTNPANFTINGVTNAAMKAFDFSLLATGSNSVLEIHGRQDPAVISFDNISLNAVSTPTDIPEPSSLALLGLGLLGACTLRRRKSV